MVDSLPSSGSAAVVAVRSLFSDADFLAVDKPSDTLMDGNSPVTMAKLVSSLFPLPPLPPGAAPEPHRAWRHVHQLDFGTSGVLLYAAHRGAAAAAGACFEARRTKKEYVAIVEGHVGPGVLSLPGVRAAAGSAPAARDAQGARAWKRAHVAAGVAGVVPPRPPAHFFKDLARRGAAGAGGGSGGGGAYPAARLRGVSWSELGELVRGHAAPVAGAEGGEAGGGGGGGAQQLDAALARLSAVAEAGGAADGPWAVAVLRACHAAARADAARFAEERASRALAAATAATAEATAGAAAAPPSDADADASPGGSPEALVDIPIAELASHMAVGAFPGGPPGAPPGRPAQTLVRVLARGAFAGRPASKLALTPLSGRRHQLRLHCAALGHPIVGDAAYSSGGGAAGERAPAPRMCLAAVRLEVELEWLRTLPARSQRAARAWAEARASAGGGAPLQPLVAAAGDPFAALEGWVEEGKAV